MWPFRKLVTDRELKLFKQNNELKVELEQMHRQLVHTRRLLARAQHRAFAQRKTLRQMQKLWDTYLSTKRIVEYNRLLDEEGARHIAHLKRPPLQNVGMPQRTNVPGNEMPSLHAID